MKNILFLVIEGNSNKGCGGSGGRSQEHYHRLLEDECELFLSRWYSKTLNQEFSEIETYLICSSNNPPSQEFINRILKRYELIRYVHCPHTVSETFPAGWFNTPLAGKWLEENIDYDLAIHLDLDMILLKKFDSAYLELKDGQIANCAVYHPDFPDDHESIDGVPKDFVTCFIVSSRQGKFYSRWWEVQYQLQQEYIEKFGDSLNPQNEDLWWDYCNIEEHAVDKLYHIHKEPIAKIEYCQFGSSQGYGTVKDSIEHLDQLNFLHCHINNDWKGQLSEYTKAKLAKLTGK